MKTLMGIPAFRLSELVRRSVNSALVTPADVLVIDNGADEDVKATLAEYGAPPSVHSPNRVSPTRGKRITTIVNLKNMFCNGAWNQILHYGLRNEYELIVLNTDVSLHFGWYDLVTARAQNFNKEVWLPRIGVASSVQDYKNGVVAENVAGSCVFLTREAAELVYPIPHQLKQWFGDQYMFTKLRKRGWNTVVLDDLTGDHQWTRVTEATPEAYTQIEQDKVEWEKIKW